MLTSMQRLFVLVFCFGILCSLGHAACYYPNGIAMGEVDRIFNYTLCDSNTEFSMCCAAGNTCRPDGLCFTDSTELIYRKGCTDPTWASPSCVKLCYNGIGFIGNRSVDMAAWPIAVTTCKDGSYCCGNGTLADACCSTNLGLFIINGSAVPRNSAFSMIVSRTTASSSPTSSQISSTSTTPTSSSFLAKQQPPPARAAETGAIVGGTIGGVAVLVLGALIWKILDRRKLPPGSNDKNGNETPQSSSLSSRAAFSNPCTVSPTPRNGENIDGSSGVQEGNGGIEIGEVDGADATPELDPARTRYEMY